MKSDQSRMTSASLIEGMQAGREDAWIRMTCLFGPLVFKWIRKISKNCLQSHDMTDISQEVFLGATENIAKYRHSREKHGSFRGWLFGITRNKVHQYFRVNSQVPRPIDDADKYPHWDPELFADDMGGDGEVWNLDQGHTHEAIEIVRLKSENHTWQAFWRTVVNGEETSDVAEDLGMTSRALRQSRHRTIQRLIREIDKLEKASSAEKCSSK